MNANPFQKSYEEITIVTQSGKSKCVLFLSLIFCKNEVEMELMQATMLARSKIKQKKKRESKIALLSGLPQKNVTTAFRCERT